MSIGYEDVALVLSVETNIWNNGFRTAVQASGSGFKAIDRQFVSFRKKFSRGVTVVQNALKRSTKHFRLYRDNLRRTLMGPRGAISSIDSYVSRAQARLNQIGQSKLPVSKKEDIISRRDSLSRRDEAKAALVKAQAMLQEAITRQLEAQTKIKIIQLRIKKGEIPLSEAQLKLEGLILKKETEKIKAQARINAEKQRTTQNVLRAGVQELKLEQAQLRIQKAKTKERVNQAAIGTNIYRALSATRLFSTAGAKGGLGAGLAFGQLATAVSLLVPRLSVATSSMYAFSASAVAAKGSILPLVAVIAPLIVAIGTLTASFKLIKDSLTRGLGFERLQIFSSFREWAEDGAGGLRRLKDELYAVSAATGVAVEEIQKISKRGLGSGIEAENIDEFTFAVARLQKITGEFGQGEKVASVISTILKNFNLEADKSIAVAQRLATAWDLSNASFTDFANQLPDVVALSSSLGMSLEESLGTFAFLSRRGSPGKAATQMRQVLTKLLKQTKTMKDKLQDKYGLNTSQILLDEGFLGLLRSMKEAAGGTDKALAELFGGRRIATGIVKLTQGTDDASKNFSKLAELIDELLGSTNEFKKGMSDPIDNSPLIQLQRAWNEVKVSIAIAGDQLKDFFIELGGVDTLRNFSKGIKELAFGLREIGSEINKVKDSPILKALLGYAKFQLTGGVAGMAIGEIIEYVRSLGRSSSSFIKFERAQDRLIKKEKELQELNTRLRSTELEQQRAARQEAFEIAKASAEELIDLATKRWKKETEEQVRNQKEILKENEKYLNEYQRQVDDANKNITNLNEARYKSERDAREKLLELLTRNKTEGEKAQVALEFGRSLEQEAKALEAIGKFAEARDTLEKAFTFFEKGKEALTQQQLVDLFVKLQSEKGRLYTKEISQEQSNLAKATDNVTKYSSAVDIAKNRINLLEDQLKVFDDAKELTEDLVRKQVEYNKELGNNATLLEQTTDTMDRLREIIEKLPSIKSKLGLDVLQTELKKAKGFVDEFDDKSKSATEKEDKTKKIDVAEARVSVTQDAIIATQQRIKNLTRLMMSLMQSREETGGSNMFGLLSGRTPYPTLADNEYVYGGKGGALLGFLSTLGLNQYGLYGGNMLGKFGGAKSIEGDINYYKVLLEETTIELNKLKSELRDNNEALQKLKTESSETSFISPTSGVEEKVNQVANTVSNNSTVTIGDVTIQVPEGTSQEQAVELWDKFVLLSNRGQLQPLPQGVV